MLQDILMLHGFVAGSFWGVAAYLWLGGVTAIVTRTYYSGALELDLSTKLFFWCLIVLIWPAVWYDIIREEHN